MTHLELDELLPKLNKDLEVRRYHNLQGLNDGIYYRGKYICAIQQGFVPTETEEDCKENFFGYIPNRSVDNLARVLMSNHIIAPMVYYRMMRAS